jgi:hypothetical protein
MALPLLSIHTALLQPDRQIRRPDGGICRSLWSEVGSNAQEGDRRQSPHRRARRLARAGGAGYNPQWGQRLGGRDVTDNSLVIIGAGLAGLSTGCYAQMSGYRSHVFERRARRRVAVPVLGPPRGAAAVPSGQGAVFGEVR